MAVVSWLLSAAAIGAPYSGTFRVNYDFDVIGYGPGQRFSRPAGVFYDSFRDQVLVADSGNGQIVILDSKGVPLTRIKHHYQDPLHRDRKPLPGEPRSVVVMKNGDMLVADSLCEYLDVVDFRGRSMQKIYLGELIGKPKSRVQPLCLALDTNENIYAAVSGDANGIVVLDRTLALKSQIAMVTGSGSGMQAITGIWVDKAGTVYTTYLLGDCVRVYSPDGKKIVSFGSHEAGFENFSLPCGIVTDSRGNIWTADALRHTVSIFRPDAKKPEAQPQVTDLLGGFGQGRLQFANPSALAGDGMQKVFILEKTGARLQAITIVFTDTPAAVAQ